MTLPDVTTERINGIVIAYRRWPAPRRAAHPPVVLLHGVLQTGEGMGHLAELLALDGEVIVPDLRGRGLTERTADGYDPEIMAGDVAALLDQLSPGRAVVVGRLHGGVVAYHLAARRPDAMCGLVLGEANPEVSAERAARVQERIAALPAAFASREDAERFYEEELHLSAARARHDLPSDLVAHPDGSLRWRHDLSVVAQIEAAAMPRSDWAVLGAVECPTLILRGQRGDISPAAAAKVTETMRLARVQTIYGAGYDVFLGPGAEQTQAAIQLFLRGLGSDPS